MKIIKVVLIFFLGLAISAACGCATTTTLQLEDYSGPRDNAVSARTKYFGELHNEYGCKDASFNSIPYVYSGSKKALINLTQPLHCGLDKGELSLINNFMYFLFYPIMLIDLPLSFVADTVLLPYTIPKQYKDGDIIVPIYLRIGKKYARRNDSYRYVHSPLPLYDEKMIADYYEKGLETLPKYFGNMSYAEINSYLISSILDDSVLWLAQYYEKQGNSDKSRYYYEKHKEMISKPLVRSQQSSTTQK